MYQNVQTLTGKIPKIHQWLKIKMVIKVIECKKKKLERWAEHFRELLNVEPAKIALEDITAKLDELEIELSPPTKSKFSEQLESLKTTKLQHMIRSQVRC